MFAPPLVVCVTKLGQAPVAAFGAPTGAQTLQEVTTSLLPAAPAPSCRVAGKEGGLSSPLEMSLALWHYSNCRVPGEADTNAGGARPFAPPTLHGAPRARQVRRLPLGPQ